MADLGDLKSVYELYILLQRIWHKRALFACIELGLVIIAVVNTWTAVDWAALSIIDIEAFETAALRSLPWYLAVVLFPLVWWVTIRLPQARRGTIGIAVAISTEADKERKRIKSDFLQSLVANLGGYGERITVLTLNEFRAADLLTNPQRRNCYHRRTRCSLLVYGHCSTRMQNGREVYYLSVYTSVTHKPLPKDFSNAVGRHMLEVLPIHHLVPVDSELQGFMIMSDYFKLASLYLLGLSAFLSGAMEVAIGFHSPLYESVKVSRTRDALINSLHDKCRRHLIAELDRLATDAYVVMGDLEKMMRHVERILEIDPDNWPAHLRKGLYLFVKDRDVDGAIRETRLAKNSDDAIWMYNLAFLFAYKGDLDKCYTWYSRAFSNSATPSAHVQAEEFIYTILDEEPHVFQLHYCLGLVYYLYRHDIELARGEFLSFLDNARGTQFEKWAPRAKNYIDEIDLGGAAGRSEASPATS